MQQDIVYSIFYISMDYPILHYTNLTILRTRAYKPNKQKQDGI